MRIWSAVLIVAALLVIISWSFSEEAVASSAEKTVVVSVGEWPPLIAEQYQYHGGLCRVITEIFALEGVKVEFKWVPWKRAYIGTKGGVYDMTPAWSKSEEREAEMIFSDPLYETYHVFYHLKSFPFDWQSYDDLHDMTVGRTLGFYYGAEFQQAEQQGIIIVDDASYNANNFMKLVHGRIQLFPINVLTSELSAKESLTPKELSLITYHPKPLTTPTMHYALFSKNDTNIRMRHVFNRGLKQLKENGTFDLYLKESRQGKYDPK